MRGLGSFGRCFPWRRDHRKIVCSNVRRQMTKLFAGDDQVDDINVDYSPMQAGESGYKNP